VLDSLVEQIAAGAAAYAAAAGLFKPLRRPVHWLWERNVSEPVGRWAHNTVREIVREEMEPVLKELTPNGGSSTKDRIELVAKEVDALSDQMRHVVRIAQGIERKYNPPEES